MTVLAPAESALQPTPTEPLQFLLICQVINPHSRLYHSELVLEGTGVELGYTLKNMIQATCSGLMECRGRGYTLKLVIDERYDFDRDGIHKAVVDAFATSRGLDVRVVIAI